MVVDEAAPDSDRPAVVGDAYRPDDTIALDDQALACGLAHDRTEGARLVGWHYSALSQNPPDVVGGELRTVGGSVEHGVSRLALPVGVSMPFDTIKRLVTSTLRPFGIVFISHDGIVHVRQDVRA